MNWLAPGGLVLLLASVLPLSASPPAGPVRATPASAAAGWVTPIPPYPAAARPLRAQGRATLLVHTGPDGRVAEVRLQPGTGSRTLDEATVAFVRSRWRGPANQSLVRAVDFRLLSAPPPRPGASIQAPSPPPSSPGPRPATTAAFTCWSPSSPTAGPSASGSSAPSAPRWTLPPWTRCTRATWPRP